jgi:phosphoglycolate phosphatase
VSGLRLVVFDIDGTLIDSQNAIITAMQAAFDMAGAAAPEPAAIRAIIGLSLPVAVTALAPRLAGTKQREIVEAYRLCFTVARAEGGAETSAPLFPGMREILADLDAGCDCLLGVATGKARRGLDHVLRVHDIGRHFVTLQTADFHPSKPHPSMLEQALRETGCTPAHAVMIGDTEFDIVMGRNAGYSTIAVAWGYHPEERLVQAGADAVVHDAAALREAIDHLCGTS